MAVSQNGFSANNRALIRTVTIPGTDVRVPVRIGPAGDVLIAVAARWHKEVEPLRATDGVLDCWGYAERQIRGGSQLSNHASGTALDFRARAHPLGVTKTKTYTAKQIAAIHRIIDDFAPAVRWGGDYDDPARGGFRGSRPDPMHVEVNASEAVCRTVLARQGNSVPEEIPLSAQYEKDDRARWAKADRLEADLRGDLAKKQKQLDALTADVAAIKAAVLAKKA